MLYENCSICKSIDRQESSNKPKTTKFKFINKTTKSGSNKLEIKLHLSKNVCQALLIIWKEK